MTHQASAGKALSFQNQFKVLWYSATSGTTTPEQRCEKQKILLDLICSEQCAQPANILAWMMPVIEHNLKNVCRPPYPMAAALETFDMLFQAVQPSARHAAWAHAGSCIATVDIELFERLSAQVVKEKLLAQNEVVVGLGHTPVQRKM